MAKETTEIKEKVASIPPAAIPTNILFAEHAVTRFYHNPVHGVTIEMLEDPTYWTHVASKLRPGAHIEVLAEDNSFWADLLVLSAGRLEASVKVLIYVDVEMIGLSSVDEDDGLEVAWRGPSAKWGVIRSADREPVKDGFPSKEAAMKWRKNRKQNMAA